MSRITCITRITIIAVFSVISAGVCVHAQSLPAGGNRISGELSGELLPDEYFVTSAVTVAEGDTLRIRAGAVLYFDQYTGIEVRGGLFVLGDSASPVTLTSVNAAAGASEPAEAFDWNGVRAEDGAFLRLRHARVENSVYGVNVTGGSVNAEFDSVIFINNGYASLVREESIVASVVSGEPFSARWNTEALMERETDISAALRDNAQTCAGRSRGRLILSIGAVSTAAAGVVMTGVGVVGLDGNFRRYVSDPSDANRTAVWGSVTTASVGVLLTGIALACIGVTLAF